MVAIINPKIKFNPKNQNTMTYFYSLSTSMGQPQHTTDYRRDYQGMETFIQKEKLENSSIT